MTEIRRLATCRLTGVLITAAVVLGVVYAIRVADLTIWPAVGTGPRNGVPFRTIRAYLTSDYPMGVRIRNLGGNLLMLVPFGILLAAVTTWAPRKVLGTILGTAMGIELWQLLVASGRSVDIDDVILNTTGGALGFLVGLGLLRIAETVAPSVVHSPSSG